MRSRWTAKDDQPGPIGRRHSSTGGDAVQSLTIRTPGIIPSRRGPRKPGHSGLDTAATGVSLSAAGTAVAGAALAGAGVTAGVAGAASGAAGSASGSWAA